MWIPRGRLELFEAKWTELPDVGDTVNLDFVRNVVGKSRVAAGRSFAARQTVFRLRMGFGRYLSLNSDELHGWC